MKITFTCKWKNLNLNIDPGRLLKAKFPGGETTVRNVTIISFRDHKLITEDRWEIRKVRKWMREHPRDGVKEVK